MSQEAFALPRVDRKVEAAIVASVVPEARRLAFLPRVFGAGLMLHVESQVCSWMRALCPTYSGGYWNFVERSNGGGYMAPAAPKEFHIRVDGDGFDGRVSADVAGVIVTTFALNAMLCKGHADLDDRHEQLLDFIAEHPGWATIRAALD